MTRSRHLLPLVVSLACVGTLTGGFAVAGDLRADERRERAAAAARRAAEQERKAVAAYQQALTPVAVAVYDAVQPLQQAYTDLDDGDVSAVDVLIDVGNHLAGPDGVPALRTRLAALVPAPSLADEHELLLTAMDDYAAAARGVKPLDGSDDTSTYAGVIARGDLALDEATRDWTRPLTPVFEGVTAPPVPVEAGTDGRRPPLSHASYLREAGNLCSAGIDAYAKTGSGKDEPSLEEIRAGLRELRSRVPKIAAVRTAPADAKVVADSIRGPLTRTLEIASGFDAAIAAARRGDDAGVRAGRAQITRGEVAAEKAAAGFRAFGSELCALYLVGLEDDGGVAADDDEPRAT